MSAKDPPTIRGRERSLAVFGKCYDASMIARSAENDLTEDCPDNAAWEVLAAGLAAELVAAGVLRSQPWRAAFAATARHRFVPRILAGTTPLQVGDPDWFTTVYSDEALATRTRPADDIQDKRAITSSSSSSSVHDRSRLISTSEKNLVDIPDTAPSQTITDGHIQSNRTHRITPGSPGTTRCPER
ncbi:hypothetical protein [Amycolatopsis sp. NPDC051372]|uniref:hypothetical protein n=1 Tax=Amycolatopsis sp. NPDC051372 TaxID=3155669 RepID=UPI00341E34CD